MSCGCGEPDNDHGNPDHITRERMERAARAAGVDIEQAADNIHDSARTLTGKGGPSSSGQGRSTGGAMGREGMTQAGTMGSSGGTMGGSAPGDEAGTRQDRGVRS
jgi:hypothetical protein